MDIIFENRDGDVIDNFHNMTSVSFKVGDKINITVDNGSPEVWDVKDYRGEFEVLSIDNTFRKSYSTRYTSGVSSDNIITVVVEPII